MDKSKRFKVLIAIMLFMFGTISNLFFSTFLHQILSKKAELSMIPSLNVCIDSMKTAKNHFKLFILFELIIFLIGIFFINTNDRVYQSDLIKITPYISTPVSAGQGQFGSAKWMTEQEKKRAFPICVLNKDDEIINYLIKHGYDDLEENETCTFNDESEKEGDENI
uniref:TRAG family protein n=1 Tax=Xylanivirga thermophila TaxID=2496273 RepID=UPI001FB37F8F|nr:TRAG family protein [Xylanivirga thermophila]